MMNTMQYDIDWVKGLSDSDLIMCNLLSFMRIYHYNLLFSDVRRCIVMEQAEAYGITKIKIKLRTRDDNKYTPPPYYLPDHEAEIFRKKLIDYFEARSG